jgi:hypothetical protein
MFHTNWQFRTCIVLDMKKTEMWFYYVTILLFIPVETPNKGHLGANMNSADCSF